MPETLLDSFDFETWTVSETLDWWFLKHSKLRCWRKRTRTYKLVWSGSLWWWVFQVAEVNWLQKSMFPPQPFCWEVESHSQFSFHKLCIPVSLWPGIAMGDIWNRKVSANRDIVTDYNYPLLQTNNQLKVKTSYYYIRFISCI